MVFETDKTDIMINYLHRRKGIDVELHVNEYDIDADGIDWTQPGDDPMAYRKDYDRDLADFLDGWDGTTDITQKEGFNDLFVRGKIHPDASEGCARYDGLFRNTTVFVSIQPDKIPTIWLENTNGELMPDAVGLFRVRRIDKGEDVRTGRPRLYMRITGGAWEFIEESGSTFDREERESDVRETEYAEREALYGPSTVELDDAGEH